MFLWHERQTCFMLHLLKPIPDMNLLGLLSGITRIQKKDIPGSTIYRSVEELIAEPSIALIVVNTPTYLHYEQAKAALEAGKHVVLEKPFTVHSKEAEELIEFATKKNLIIERLSEPPL